jgi:transposase InsO family protein
VGVPRDLPAADTQQLRQQAVAARFGVGHRPEVSIQWLSDNGSIYTALDTLCTAERLNLEPITTPAASPQSNGMSEAFVNTLKRDDVSGADQSSATAILDQVPARIAEYNAVARHSVLGFREPQQYRADVLEVVPVRLTGAPKLPHELGLRARLRSETDMSTNASPYKPPQSTPPNASNKN